MGSSKLAKITEGAVAFDGTNDSLSVADSADFTFGWRFFMGFVYCNNPSTTAHKSLIQKYTTDTSVLLGSFNGYQYFYFYHGSSVLTVTGRFRKSMGSLIEEMVLRLFQDGDNMATMFRISNDSSVALTICEDGH